MTPSSSSVPSCPTPTLCSSFTVVESPILCPVHDSMDMSTLSSSQLTSIRFAGSVEDYSLPVRELDGVFTTVARDEQSEEAMPFLFQDMTRHCVSPQVARSHVLYPKVEADLTQSWKRDGCNRSHSQEWPILDRSNTCNKPSSVDRRFGMGTHFDQGQADQIMSSVTNHDSLGNKERMPHQHQPQPQLLHHHSSCVERAEHQDSHGMNTCYSELSGLSGIQIEQCAPDEIAIDMGSQPMLPNNAYGSFSTLSGPRLPSQDLSSSHGDTLFLSPQVAMDTAVIHAVVEHEMLNDTVNNTINNNYQFGNNLASTSTTYGKQDPIFNGAVAPTAPLSAQFEFVNYLPESVLTPGFHNSCLPHLQSLVKPYTPIETTAPFPTPCDNAPVFLHHPNATASYFPPLSCNEPLVTPSQGSSDMMMAQHRIIPSMMMNGRIEAPPFFQFFGSADPSVAVAMLPTHVARPWLNLAHGPQVFPDALHQSLELMNRLQILQQQQQQHQHGLEFSQAALYRHRKIVVDPVSGDSHSSTPQSTTTPFPESPALIASYATPQQFQHFPEGTVNMSAIHPSSNLDDMSSMSSPEKAQTPVDHDHNEDSDFQQNDEDEEECVVESDDGDSSYHDDLDEEEATDSYIDILLHKRRMPSPLSSQSAQGSMEEVPKRRSRTNAKARRCARTPYDPTETVPEAEQLSSTEARLSRHQKSATRFRRVRTPHAPEPEEEAAKHTPSKETRVKGRKSRARRTHTEAKEGVDDDDIPLTLPPPNILEDGSIKCSYLGCPRTFATMGLLRSHLVVHVDGKPYVCEMCDGAKRYKRNHDLLRHQRESHGEEEENDERVDDQVDEANDGGDDMNDCEAPVRRCVKREEGSRSRGGLSSGRHRKHRRTRVEHRTIWNGSEMEEIAVEMVRPRGRPRVRPLKDTPAADAFALISSSSSSSSIALTARPQIPSQNADTAKRLHEWLRIEAQATAAWSTVQESTDPFQTQRTESCKPLFAPLVEEGESNQLIKHEEDKLVMTGQWHALNARAADIQSLNSAYALHNLKEWISAPEGSSPRSPGNMVETMFHAPEAPASPTCYVAANIVAAVTESGVTAI